MILETNELFGSYFKRNGFSFNGFNHVQIESPDIKLFALLSVPINSNHVCCSQLLRLSTHVSTTYKFTNHLSFHSVIRMNLRATSTRSFKTYYIWGQWCISRYMRLKSTHMVPPIKFLHLSYIMK